MLQLSFCRQFPVERRIQNQQSRPGSLCLLPDICGGGARKNGKGHISTINISGKTIRDVSQHWTLPTLFVRRRWRTSFRSRKEASREIEAPARLGETVALGGELAVHRLGFGAMRITGDGIWGPPKNPDSVLRVLRRAVELGVNFIDTADSYGPYVSEELIAKALAPYPRDLVIATKGGWNRPGPNEWTHDASPKHLREAAEGSLRRLRVDRIDVYQFTVPRLPSAASAPSPKSLWFRRRSVGCFSRRERSAHI